MKNVLMRSLKAEQWTTCWETCEQPVRSKALQQAVGHGRLELQITLMQSQFCDVRCDAIMSSLCR